MRPAGLTGLLARYKGVNRSAAPASSAQENTAVVSTDSLLVAMEDFHKANRGAPIGIEEEDSASLDRRSLVLCFIIIDGLPLEAIWRAWLQLAPEDHRNRIKIFIHAKHPEEVSSQWVRDRLVPFNLKPEWGSIELTRVMIKLLEHVSL